MDEDASMRQATQESLMSHRQWQDRQRFCASGISTSGTGSSGASCQYQQGDLQQRLRVVDVDLERSKSMKQTKIGRGTIKSLRNKLAAAVSKLIIYERLPMNLSTSPWLHMLLAEAARLGPGIKCPSPYEISEIYLNNEYKDMQNYIEKEIKPIWKERGVTMVDKSALRIVGADDPTLILPLSDLAPTQDRVLQGRWQERRSRFQERSERRRSGRSRRTRAPVKAPKSLFFVFLGRVRDPVSFKTRILGATEMKEMEMKERMKMKEKMEHERMKMKERVEMGERMEHSYLEEGRTRRKKKRNAGVEQASPPP